MTNKRRKDEPALSDAQKAVVESTGTAILVTAGAGSGKTEVVARRVQNLLEDGTDVGGKVLALTFTVKAARELEERFNERLGALAQEVECDTIHGFAHRLIRTHGTHLGLPAEPDLLVRDDDRVELLQTAMLLDDLDATEAAALLRDLDLKRARGIESEEVQGWDRALQEAGALDYPALLARAIDLLRIASVRRQIRRLYRAVMIDEGQNLSRAQYSLILALAADSDTLAVPTMVVGDARQSIVSFAGADPGLMREFEESFNAEHHDLLVNYRTAREIARVTDAVASELHRTPVGQDTFAARGSVQFQAFASEVDEAEYIGRWIAALLDTGIEETALAPGEHGFTRPENVAVLCRTAAGLREVARALDAASIPFSLAYGQEDWLATLAGKVLLELVAILGAPAQRSSYRQLERLLGEPLESKDIQGVRVALGHSDNVLVRSVVAVTNLNDVSALTDAISNIEPPTDLGDVEAADWADDVRQISGAWSEFDDRTPRHQVNWTNFRLHCARAQSGAELRPGVRLLTIHKAQGKEFDAVAVIGLNEGQLPDFRARSIDEIRDELRVFYVAATRARRVLLLTRSQRRATRYGQRATEPSQFLRFVPFAD